MGPQVTSARGAATGGAPSIALPSDGNTVFLLDPDDATAAGGHSRLVLSGSAAQSISDANGGSIVLAKTTAGAWALDVAAADLFNGHPCLTCTSAGEGLLTTTAGPTWGNSPWSVYAVGADPGYGDGGYPAIAILGQGDGVTHHVAWIGLENAQWACDVYDGATNGAYSLSPTPDAGKHLWEGHYDGAGTLTCMIDGVQLASASISGTPALLQGFGLGPWHPSYPHAAHVAWGLWRQGNDSIGVRRQIQRYAAQRFGLLSPDVVSCYGDSLTYGYGAVTPATGGYPGRLSTALAASWAPVVTDYGISGYTTANIIANSASLPTTAPLAGGCQRNSFAVLMAGTNDVVNGVATATTIANLTSILATLTAQGYTVVVCTLFPFVNGSPASWTQANADTINAWIRANVPTKQICEWALCPQMQVPGGTLQSTWRNVSGPTEGHPNDAGYAVLANLVETALWALRA